MTLFISARKLQSKYPAAQFKRVWDRLILHREAGKQLFLLDSTQIVILTRARKKLLELIHAAHAGYTKSYKKPAQLYHWPGMKNNISQTENSCTLPRWPYTL